jgi:hypothetical protein
MAIDYRALMAQFNAAPAMRRTRHVGQGESSFLEDYDDPLSRMIDGREYTLDEATGQLRFTTGDMQSGGITTTRINPDGTTADSFEARRSMGDKWGDALRSAAPYLAAMAAIATGGTMLTGMSGAGAGSGIAGGADLAAAYGAGAGGTTAATGAAAATGAGAAAAAGAGSLLNPTTAMIAGQVASGVMAAQQGREQARAIDNASAANERIASDQAAAAERTRQDAERARQAAIAAGGSQPGQPADRTSMRNRNRSGSGSTMLTGPGGVASGSLSLGGPTLLGRLA